MKQRLHPHILWTGPYSWQDVPADHLRPIIGLSGVKIDPKSVELQYKNATVKLTPLHRGMIRLEVFAPDGKINIWPDYPKIGIVHTEAVDFVKSEETAESVRLQTSDLSVEVAKTGFSFKVVDAQGNELLACNEGSVAQSKNGLTSLFKFSSDEKDHYYGFGGRTEYPDRKGRTFDEFATKVWHERGDYGGFPMPFFLNPKGYAFILNNPYEHVYFDMGYEDPNSWFFYTPDGPVDIFILPGARFTDMLSRYHTLTGSPVLPPKWLFGFWISWFSDEEWTAKDWEEWVARFRAEGWPVNVAELDAYWRAGQAIFSTEAGDGENIKWDYEKFGDGPHMVRSMKENGVRTCLHVNTRMYSGDFLEEGLEKGYMRKASQFQAVPVLTSPESVEWNWAPHAPIVEDGVDLWWTDNGERVDGEITDRLPSRNIFGEMWNRFYYDHMVKMGHKGHLVLARGGWLGTHTNCLPWPGDTQSGVDRLKEDLWYSMNISMSGVLFCTVDQGGFSHDKKTSEDIMHRDENTIRRTIHGFMQFPVPRVHNCEKRPKWPWLYTPEVQKLYRQYLELRYRLTPYVYSAAVEGVQNSIPLTRPLIFDYTGDPGSMETFDEILFGPSILVAPVMEDGAEQRRVYLPPGSWVNYWTNEILAGGREYIVDAPLYGENGLPIFVKMDSIIPYQKVVPSITETPEPTIMLDLYVKTSAEYKLWDDAERCSTVNCENKSDGLHVKIFNALDIDRKFIITSPLLPGAKAEVDIRLGQIVEVVVNNP